MKNSSQKIERKDRKVLLTAHWDWVLYQFRLPLANALRRHGYEVAFVCPSGRYVAKLEAEGFRWIKWNVVRRSLNPFRESLSLLHLRDIYRSEQPHIIHHFTIKPNLYGAIATRLFKNGTHNGNDAHPKTNSSAVVINTFSGLGFLFSNRPSAKFLALAIEPALRMVSRFQNVWTVFQNKENMDTFVLRKLIHPDRAVLITSSGVDTKRFHPDGAAHRPKKQVPVVLFAGRLLWDKGIAEFISAAQMVRKQGIRAEFWVAGERDEGNPQCIPANVLQRWQQSDGVRWLGHRDDMPGLLRQVDIAVLPSRHEGVPRFLLEAAASGLPLIATNIEGCRMIVHHGRNGFLVPVQDPTALADALAQLISDKNLRTTMGKESRKIAYSTFDEKKILSQWLDLYENVLNHSKGSTL